MCSGPRHPHPYLIPQEDPPLHCRREDCQGAAAHSYGAATAASSGGGGYSATDGWCAAGLSPPSSPPPSPSCTCPAASTASPQDPGAPLASLHCSRHIACTAEVNMLAELSSQNILINRKSTVDHSDSYRHLAVLIDANSEAH